MLGSSVKQFNFNDFAVGREVTTALHLSGVTVYKRISLLV
jgi:hypothetical protein